MVYTCKDLPNHQVGDFVPGIGVLDMERGVVQEARAEPWQTDTCIGGWYYDTRRPYKSPLQIITMLTDIVSKNGNLLLNIPMGPEGTLDESAAHILDALAAWTGVNGEGLYGTRPWKRSAEGSTEIPAGHFGERDWPSFTAEDFRFTTKDEHVYAIALGWPEESWCVRALADEPVEDVTLLGSDEPLPWRRDAEGLHVTAPREKPCEHAWVLKARLAAS